MQKELKEIEELEEKEIITAEEDIDESDPENNENKKYDESRIYYVYEHIRLDKMEPFYIGKGKGERAYDLYRNDHHDAITDEYGHAVVIIADHLTEEEAYWLERDTIEDYVFNLGNGIDIKGHNDYDHELPHLTNMNWGGIGGFSGLNPYANKTEEEMEIIRRKIGEKSKGRNPYANKTPEEMEITRRKMSEKKKGKMVGEKNPMFGRNPYANKTPEEMEIILNKKSNSMKGKTKGKNPYANKTPEEMEIIRRKMSERVSGEKNPMWGKPSPNKGKKGKDNPTYGEKNGMWGKPSPNRSKVICTTTGKIFDCIKDAEKHYKCSNISSCCRKKTQSAGKLNGTPLQWKYVKDYNNDFKGILINPITE